MWSTSAVLTFLLKTQILRCLLRGYISYKLGSRVKSLESRIPVVQQWKENSMRTEMKGESDAGDRREEGEKVHMCVHVCACMRQSEGKQGC